MSSGLPLPRRTGQQQSDSSASREAGAPGRLDEPRPGDGDGTGTGSDSVPGPRQASESTAPAGPSEPSVRPGLPALVAAPGPEEAPPGPPEQLPPAEPPAPDEASAAPPGGMAGLSLPYQAAAAVSLALIAALACVHLAMVFLHVAPSNTVTKQHGEAVDGWVYPEFEQNWKLFAPNPLQQNIAIQARAQYTARDGSRQVSDWVDFSAEDGEQIRHNLLPSHLQQNQLRRAWDFYVGSHDTENKPDGLRGRLSESYMRRIVMLRLDPHDLGGPVERIQLRASTRAIEAPDWSDEKIDTRTVHRELPWWTVTAADLPGGVGNDRTEAAR
ncbi:DUF5819 family protein [Streptomyces peucetius]|uniref:DUF5819 family protein n=1 Tax=Streptomyces peucetius TaxID=1950 RepID=A0ABY6I8J8_STRPE|nr:DUF5819 family protein [Streptomyces peucetius]UYQ63320.1 DUF5819 family protein [Streptomyces peucetius]